jgi:hypothetical protein
MNMRIDLKLVLTVFLLGMLSILHAQQYSNYDQQKKDSLAAAEYDQVLPIWGKQAIEKGFNLPEPLGIATNYMHFKQGLLLDNIFVGFEGAGFRYKIARLLGLRMGVDVARGPEEWAFYIVFGNAWIK